MTIQGNKTLQKVIKFQKLNGVNRGQKLDREFEY